MLRLLLINRLSIHELCNNLLVDIDWGKKNNFNKLQYKEMFSNWEELIGSISDKPGVETLKSIYNYNKKEIELS